MIVGTLALLLAVSVQRAGVHVDCGVTGSAGSVADRVRPGHHPAGEFTAAAALTPRRAWAAEKRWVNCPMAPARAGRGR